MRLDDRLIAGVVWLEKFTIFSPMNFSEDKALHESIVQWGNYAIGNNLYPNLFSIFVKYSPTADILLNKAVRLIFGNIPKDVKNQKTTLESVFTNSIQNLIKNAGRDAMLYKGSFALWVGYNKDGKCNEFKWIPIELIRYVKRDQHIYTHTDNENMIAIMDSGTNKVSSLYYPYEPDKILEQQESLIEGQEEDNKLKAGQILFHNTADIQTYPDCVFNSMLPLLLTDAGVDTLIMSYLANADLLKTYKKKAGATGADTANGFSGLFDGQVLNSIWGLDRAQDLTATAQYGSDFNNTGVKSGGSTELLNIPTDESIDNYVHDAKFPQFVEELNKIDERVARKLCIALEMPYEYIYKMDSGVINQENREMLIKEINMLFEDIRETFENIINALLDQSVFEWRLSIRPIGEGKEDVAEANENLTGE